MLLNFLPEITTIMLPNYRENFITVLPNYRENFITVLVLGVRYPVGPLTSLQARQLDLLDAVPKCGSVVGSDHDLLPDPRLPNSRAMSWPTHPQLLYSSHCYCWWCRVKEVHSHDVRFSWQSFTFSVPHSVYIQTDWSKTCNSKEQLDGSVLIWVSKWETTIRMWWKLITTISYLVRCFIIRSWCWYRW